MPNSSGPMACPVDGATLVMSERSGIEIDYCPTCRGVWLDRGELDKIIERSAAPASAAAAPGPVPYPQAPQPGPAYGQPPQPGFGAPFGQGHGRHHPYGKRKKSFLEELFD